MHPSFFSLDQVFHHRSSSLPCSYPSHRNPAEGCKGPLKSMEQHKMLLPHLIHEIWHKYITKCFCHFALFLHLLPYILVNKRTSVYMAGGICHKVLLLLEDWMGKKYFHDLVIFMSVPSQETKQQLLLLSSENESIFLRLFWGGCGGGGGYVCLEGCVQSGVCEETFQ